MKDWLHELLKKVDYERGKIFGILIGIVIVVAVVGCDIQVKSPISGEKVNKDQFKIEVATAENTLDQQRLEIEKLQADYNEKAALHNEQVQTGNDKFVKAEEFRSGFIDLAAGAAINLATGGQVNTTELLMSCLTLAGIGGTVGGMVDSARKNKVIEAKSSETVAT